MTLQRRQWLRWGLAAAPAAVLGCAAVTPGASSIGRVVVVGGGFGGATAAKYIRKWEPRIDVTLVEREEYFVSCPMSNLVVAGIRPLADITRPYSGLARHGVRVVRDSAEAIDFDGRQVRLARGDVLPYDRLILAPGIDMQYERIPGLQAGEDAGLTLHAWKAGAQTVALHRQLQAMRDGGVFAISIPRAPYRCPPGPYERASLVAQYLKQHKPRSKVLILDANPEITSKRALFTKAWDDMYKGLIEYRPDSELAEFDSASRTAKLQLEDVQADVFNLIPPQQAARIAQPLITVNKQWVGVEFLTFESLTVPGVHVIGDAISPASAMPKSATMANNQAKVVADAVIARLSGQPVNEATILTSTCYSYVSDTEAMHIASVHKWDAEHRTLVPMPGSGGLSPARSEAEGSLARGWAANIWADALT